MKYTLAIGALAASATAAAAPEIQKRQSVDPSAVLVLATALPSSLLQLAITNSPAVASEVASEFAAGSTPGWYSALPGDIKTYLSTAYAAAAPTGSGASVLSSAASVASSAASSAMMTPRPSMAPSMPYGINGTMSGVAGGGSGSGTITSTSSSGGSSSSSGSDTTAAGGGSSAGSGGASRSAGAGGSSAVTTGGAPAQTALGMGVAGLFAVAGLVAL